MVYSPQAVIVIAWIAYCLFVRERHKSELYQYDIGDLKIRNQLNSLSDEHVDREKEKEVTAGVIFLPSRHRQIDDYEKRPDYPESSASMNPSTDRLIEILNDSDDGVETAAHYKDGIYEVDMAPAPYHSDV